MCSASKYVSSARAKEMTLQQVLNVLYNNRMAIWWALFCQIVLYVLWQQAGVSPSMALYDGEALKVPVLTHMGPWITLEGIILGLGLLTLGMHPVMSELANGKIHFIELSPVALDKLLSTYQVVALIGVVVNGVQIYLIIAQLVDATSSLPQWLGGMFCTGLFLLIAVKIALVVLVNTYLANLRTFGAVRKLNLSISPVEETTEISVTPSQESSNDFTGKEFLRQSLLQDVKRR